MNHICYPCFPCYLRDLIVIVSSHSNLASKDNERPILRWVPMDRQRTPRLDGVEHSSTSGPITTYAPSPSGQIFSSRPISPGKKAIAPIPSTATESARQPSPKNNNPKTSNKITHFVFINQLPDTLKFPSIHD